MGQEMKTERFQMCLEKSTVEAVDNWSFENRVRTRAEAIRQLIQRGLESTETKKADVSA